MKTATLLRLGALTAAVLTVLIVPLSAYLRHSDSVAVIASLGAPWSGLAAAQMAHRLIATVVGALALALAASAWVAPRAWAPARIPALILLVMVVLLAGVGMIAGDSDAPAVALVHLTGGMLAAAAACWLAMERSPHGSAAPPARPARAATLTAAGAVLSGGLAAVSPGPRTAALHGIVALVAATIAVWAVLVGLLHPRPTARDWLALGTVAAALATGWWAHAGASSPAAATIHNAAAVLLLVEITRWLFERHTRSTLQAGNVRA